MAEMLTVPTTAATLLHPVILWQDKRRFAHDTGHRLEPMGTQASGIDRDAGIDQAALAVVDVKHLTRKGPEIVDRRLRAAVAFLGAVAETDDPFGSVPDMIGAFLFRLRRDRRQRRIA